jgi:hypothetical protein
MIQFSYPAKGGVALAMTGTDTQGKSFEAALKGGDAPKSGGI